ncbi:unnamed protein product [Protopolystoma xenopodis]|uniref:Uncharacterized protein n=1 Tax=Protopolystoma xenopodis TaxID=117903 RepID=A0A448XP71_9PLAT|nr:unnamed protein product [Protopolystoma xenopodis]
MVEIVNDAPFWADGAFHGIIRNSRCGRPLFSNMPQAVSTDVHMNTTSPLQQAWIVQKEGSAKLVGAPQSLAVSCMHEWLLRHAGHVTVCLQHVAVSRAEPGRDLKGYWKRQVEAGTHTLAMCVVQVTGS